MPHLPYRRKTRKVPLLIPIAHYGRADRPSPESDQALRRLHGRGRRFVRHPARRDPGPAGPERRRQDHDHPDAPGAHHADRRRDPHVRAALRPPPGGDPGPGELLLDLCFDAAGPDCRREPPGHRQTLRDESRHFADRRHRQAVGDGGVPDQDHPQALLRPDDASLAGQGLPDRPQGPVPGRADGQPRPRHRG